MSDVKDQAAPRKTLKLNAALVRKAPVPKAATNASKAAANAPKAAAKPAAAVDWAAEHKRRMQADMDALSGNREK